MKSLSFFKFIANLKLAESWFPTKKWSFILQKLKISNIALTLLLWVKVLFLPKNTYFCKNMLTFAGGSWYQKYIYWNCIYVCTYTPMWVYLRTNFQVSSIILTSFRHREPCVCVCVCVLGWGEGGGRWWGERK